MNTILKQGFYIPMVSSLLLLAVFIGYFLKTEYNKEKDAIILENRDAAFVDLFSNIRKAGPVEWRKDAQGNEVIIKLERIDSSVHSQKTHHQDSIVIHSNASFIERTEVMTFDENEDSIVSLTETVREVFPHNLRIKGSPHVKEEFVNDSIISVEIMDLATSETGTPNFIYKNDIEIDPWKIWKRLYPQILFSLLLFGSIISAFYMIARNLNKEKQLSQLRNEFMSNMSHELKTPVSTISVALEALSNFDAANDAHLRKEYIDISKSEVERLGLLVDKALNISLYEQGKFIYDKQDLDLNAEIRHVLNTLKVPLDNQNVELSYAYSGNGFVINADKTHIINVVHNLIENAIKYTEQSPKIGIRLTEASDTIELSISDNGKGIAPEYQDKIFDKFFRVPQGDTHNIKGHGLGLSYVKQVIDSHGGSIKVKSGVEAGTTFIIKLPKASQL